LFLYPATVGQSATGWTVIGVNQPVHRPCWHILLLQVPTLGSDGSFREYSFSPGVGWIAADIYDALPGSTGHVRLTNITTGVGPQNFLRSLEH
jgi:hypothetical protein